MQKVYPNLPIIIQTVAGDKKKKSMVAEIGIKNGSVSRRTQKSLYKHFSVRTSGQFNADCTNANPVDTADVLSIIMHKSLIIDI